MLALAILPFLYDVEIDDAFTPMHWMIIDFGCEKGSRFVTSSRCSLASDVPRGESIQIIRI